MIQRLQIEANITRHCNLRCVACSHASAFAKKHFMKPEDLERDLAVLSPILHVKTFLILGGEPLLHPQLTHIMDIVMNSGICDLPAVVTNGFLLPLMKDDFFDRLLSLHITAYPKLDRSILEDTRKRFAGKFALHISDVENFFTQFVVSDETGSTFEMCPWARPKGEEPGCLTVHEGYIYLCPQSAFFPGEFGDDDQDPYVDGMSLSGVTEDSLSAFLNRTAPLETCSICNSYTNMVPWHECKNIKEWMYHSIWR